MARVTFEDGTVINFEGQPTPEDIDAAYASVKGGGGGESAGIQLAPLPTEPQSMGPDASGEAPLGQRFAAGFKANKSQEMAYYQRQNPNSTVSMDNGGNVLVDGKRVDPAGLELGDVVEALPGLPQNVAGIAGGLAGAAAGTAAMPGVGTVAGGMAGAAGAQAAGDLARVQAGRMFGMDPSLADAAGSAGFEGAMGAAGEAGGQLLGKAAQAVSPRLKELAAPVLRAYDKVGKKFGSEGRAMFWSRIVSGVKDERVPREAIEELSKGNMRVLDEATTNETFLRTAADKALFGKSDTTPERHIYELYEKSPQEAQDIARDFLGMPDDVFKSIIDNRGQIPAAFKDDGMMTRITNRFQDRLMAAKKSIGDAAGQAHNEFYQMIKDSPMGKVKQDMTEANRALIEKLKPYHVLLETPVTDPVTGKTKLAYALNPDYQSLGGKEIYNHYEHLLDKMFGTMKEGGQKFYVPENSIQLKDLVRDEATRSILYTDKLFDEKLRQTAPALADYMSRYREKIYQAAEHPSMRFGKLRAASKDYADFAKLTSEVRGLNDLNNPQAVESVLRAYYRGGLETARTSFSKVAAKVDKEMLADLDRLAAGRFLTEKMGTRTAREELSDKVMTLMKQSFKDDSAATYLRRHTRMLAQSNPDLDLARAGRDWHIASTLNSIKPDLFKARMIGIGGMLSLIPGVNIWGSIPAAVGIGYAAQSKEPLKGALMAAGRSRAANIGVEKTSAKLAAKQASRETLAKLSRIAARAGTQAAVRRSSEERQPRR